MHKWSSERKDKNTPERKDRVGKDGWRKKGMHIFCPLPPAAVLHRHCCVGVGVEGSVRPALA